MFRKLANQASRSQAKAAALAVVICGSVLVGGTAWAGDIPITGEDEDAYVNVRPTPGHSTGFGTGFLNQVRAATNGVVTSNIASGSFTIYGLAPRSTHMLYIGAGPGCPGSRRALGSTMRITADGLGGWHGPVSFRLGPKGAWVVRGANHLSVSSGSTIGTPVAACGTISDDPDIAD